MCCSRGEQSGPIQRWRTPSLSQHLALKSIANASPRNASLIPELQIHTLSCSFCGYCMTKQQGMLTFFFLFYSADEPALLMIAVHEQRALQSNVHVCIAIGLKKANGTNLPDCLLSLSFFPAPADQHNFDMSRHVCYQSTSDRCLRAESVRRIPSDLLIKKVWFGWAWGSCNWCQTFLISITAGVSTSSSKSRVKTRRQTFYTQVA